MRDFQVPNGLGAMGFERGDVGRLTEAAVKSGSLKLSPRLPFTLSALVATFVKGHLTGKKRRRWLPWRAFTSGA